MSFAEILAHFILFAWSKYPFGFCVGLRIHFCFSLGPVLIAFIFQLKNNVPNMQVKTRKKQLLRWRRALWSTLTHCQYSQSNLRLQPWPRASLPLWWKASATKRRSSCPITLLGLQLQAIITRAAFRLCASWANQVDVFPRWSCSQSCLIDWSIDVWFCRHLTNKPGTEQPSALKLEQLHWAKVLPRFLQRRIVDHDSSEPRRHGLSSVDQDLHQKADTLVQVRHLLCQRLPSEFRSAFAKFQN